MGRRNAFPTLSRAAAPEFIGVPSACITLILMTILPNDRPFWLREPSISIQYRNRRTPLGLKNGIQLGQPEMALKLKPVIKLMMSVMNQMMAASMSHAKKRSHQNAKTGPEAAVGWDGAFVNGIDGVSWGFATVAPHLGQKR